MSMAIKPNILLVEDDFRLAELVSNYLSENGFQITVENHGDRVLGRVQRDPPDLIILDLMLPGRDGFEICKDLRPIFTGPILMLTARNSDFDQVLGLELGADDYVIKPVEPRILLARINTLLRRCDVSAVNESDELRFGALSINKGGRVVRLQEKTVPLSSHEFDLLLALSARAGEVQSRDTLYQRLYNRPYDGLDRIVDVRISHLRKKLDDNTDNPYRIKTVWGRGYLFVPDAW
jgi:DNA-binding response OmpR family regulator